MNLTQLNSYILEDIGFEKDFKDSFHCTIAYSKKPFDMVLPGGTIGTSEVDIHEKAVIKGFGNFDTPEGFNLHVVLESPFLVSEHKRCLKNGAVFDYDEYIPHITLMYNCIKDNKPIKVDNIPKLKKYIGSSVLINKELKSPLNENWVNESKKDNNVF